LKLLDIEDPKPHLQDLDISSGPQVLFVHMQKTLGHHIHALAGYNPLDGQLANNLITGLPTSDTQEQSHLDYAFVNILVRIEKIYC